MQSYINVNLKSSTSSASRRKNFKPDEYLTKYERRRRLCKLYFQKIVAFSFSQIGVGALLVGYTIIGALIFVEVESGEENRRLGEVDLIKKEVVSQLWNVTSNYNVIYLERWKSEVDLIVEKFQNSLVREIQLGYDGSSDPIWTFPSALMYSLSVFTTIGYGNLAPKTDWGKALTIFYALFGIPLLLLYMANVGTLLATSFRQFYTSVNRCKSQLEKMRKTGMMTRLREEWPSHQGGRYVVGRRTECVHDIQEEEEEQRGIGVKKGVRSAKENTDGEKKIGDNRSSILSVHSSSDNEYSANEVTIPISTCLSVFTLYIFFGSLVFSWWESWDYLDGSYFCFVSLVTIGFGDIIPGTAFHLSEASRSDHRNQVVDGQLIFCSIYILLGMALMAMCFHLTQERIFLNAKKVGKFFHLI